MDSKPVVSASAGPDFETVIGSWSGAEFSFHGADPVAYSGDTHAVAGDWTLAAKSEDGLGVWFECGRRRLPSRQRTPIGSWSPGVQRRLSLTR